MAWGIGEQTGAHPDPQSIPFLACRGHRASKKGVDARGWKLYHRPLGPSTQGSTSFLSFSLSSSLPLFLSLSVRCSFRCSILIRPTHQICASSSHEILSLKALAAPGASERLFDFRGARQVPAAIRGSCAIGRPRPSSASLDPHSAILRSRDPAAAPLLARSLHLRPATGLSAAREYPVPRGKGGEVTRSSDRSSGCAPGNHHLTHLPSPLSFRTRVRVIRLQLLPRRILIQRTPSVHPASTTADPCTAACPV